MLDNQPMVKVFADGATVRLLLDTGAEATVLTPAAARRIGAQHARVKLGRQMHGITGDIPAGELELRSFTIGGVEVPRTTQRNAAITDYTKGQRSVASDSEPNRPAQVNGRCRPFACRTRCSPPARKRSPGEPIGAMPN
jgi:hypothetical protein